MNLLEIRTDVRRVLAEISTTATFYSETDLNRWINEGLKEACVKGFALQYTKTVTVTTGVASYTLPIDFIRDLALLNPLGVSLTKMDASGVGRVYIVTGKPIYYYITQTLLSPTTRANLTLYALGTILVPAAANGYIYEVTVGGTTAAAPPVYPTTVGGSVVDGTVTLTCREMMTRIWSLTLVDTPTTTGGGTGVYTLVYNAIDEGLYVDTDSPNIPGDVHHYLVDYACYKAMLTARQFRDMIPFVTSFCAGFGIDVKGMETGGQA